MFQKRLLLCYRLFGLIEPILFLMETGATLVQFLSWQKILIMKIGIIRIILTFRTFRKLQDLIICVQVKSLIKVGHLLKQVGLNLTQTPRKIKRTRKMAISCVETVSKYYAQNILKIISNWLYFVEGYLGNLSLFPYFYFYFFFRFINKNTKDILFLISFTLF